MVQGFTSARVETPGAAINRRRGGKASLVERFSVLLADLRGCGDSAKPPASDDHWRHSRRAVAAEQIAMMPQPGSPRFSGRRRAFLQA